MSALGIAMVTVKGKGAHGSTPHLSIDPIQISAQMIVNLANIQSRELSPYDVAAFTIGKFVGGTKGNIIPPEASFTGSIRYFEKAVGEKMEASIKRIINNVAEAHRATVKLTYVNPVPPTVNDPECAGIARKSLVKIAGKESVADIKPWMASESFALYAEKYPSVFAMVGIKNEAKGTHYDHHTPEFDIDEDALKIGVALTIQYTLDFLNTK
jgi:amidohydrolase